MAQLAQFGDLTPMHFTEHPVWVSCHSFDYDEPWYNNTDEETFRPHTEGSTVNPSDGMYLVSARFQMANSTLLRGFITPANAEEQEDRVLGLVQPQIFLPSGDRVGFWLGMFGDPEAEAARLYTALGADRNSVFPIAFEVDPELVLGIVAGTINGFYTVPDGSTVHVTV